LLAQLHELAALVNLQVARPEPVGLRLRKEIVVGFAEQMLAIPTEQLLARSIESKERVIARALHEDHVGDVLDHRLEKAVGFSQLLRDANRIGTPSNDHQ